MLGRRNGEEIFQQLLAGKREDRLGMKLHPVHGKFAMPQSHDLILGSPRSDFQILRKRLAFDDQRMIPRGLKGLGQCGKYPTTIVVNHGGLSMHQARRADDIAAIHMAHALMTETDTQDRQMFTKRADDIATDAGLQRRAGTRGDADPLGFKFGNFFQRNFIIAANDHLSPQLAKILDEVVGEGIVVVDDEEHGGGEFRKCEGKPHLGRIAVKIKGTMGGGRGHETRRRKRVSDVRGEVS